MNVQPLHSGIVVETTEPDAALISRLEGLVAQARSGQLQSFVGCGFTADGLLVEHVECNSSSMFRMLGGLHWLVESYTRSCRPQEEQS